MVQVQEWVFSLPCDLLSCWGCASRGVGIKICLRATRERNEFTLQHENHSQTNIDGSAH